MFGQQTCSWSHLEVYFVLPYKVSWLLLSSTMFAVCAYSSYTYKSRCKTCSLNISLVMSSSQVCYDTYLLDLRESVLHVSSQ
jgi:hypothetical protein